MSTAPDPVTAAVLGDQSDSPAAETPRADDAFSFWKDHESPPAQMSRTRATCGRVVLCFCPMLWQGPRPGLVVTPEAFGDDQNKQAVQRITANVELDGARDGGVIRQLGTHGQGRTLFAVPLFDALTDEQRQAVAEAFKEVPACWCEWMPYQVGQVRKTEEVSGPVQAAIRKLAAHFGADTQAEIEALFA